MAELHRDAMIRVLRERGNGDILKGLLLAPQWTVKAMQWCVFPLALPRCTHANANQVRDDGRYTNC